MSDNVPKKNHATSDSEEALQAELKREAAEGRGSAGDVSENRTLSGSSSWDTLPDSDASGPSAPSKGGK